VKTTLDAIGLVVADMARSLDFYRRLGLEIPAEADGESHVSIELPSGLRLMWDTIDVVRSFDPEWTLPHDGPATSLAFLCESPAEVDRMYATLVDAGFDGHREPWDAFWGQRYATLRDPDGNGIDLFTPLDASTAAS
jgi:catechol 2,3-dioxygenase-like lactoylglutathione lyase family enzyme